MGFYEEIADRYDGMTRFDERLEAEKAILEGWIARYPIASVVDAACGTGLHAILLTQMGISTIGADSSGAMIARAREHAEKAGVNPTWVQAPMEELGDVLKAKVDAVFCLGNSLPHLLTRDDLAAALRSFAKLLAPGGLLIVQLLNYRRILDQGERIVGVHKHGQQEFIRFYDFEERVVQFNLLILTWQDQKCTHTLHRTKLYPYTGAELEPALLAQGFNDLQSYGDMRFQPYLQGSSPNLVVVARRAAEGSPRI